MATADAAAAAANDYPNHLQVEPGTIKFNVTLGVEQFLNLTLTNTSTELLAFKVKTTAPNRYGVKPTQDYINPGESKVCEIVMARMNEVPNTTQRDKFLVQSVIIAGGERVDNLPGMWKELEKSHKPAASPPKFVYYDQKIKCRLHLPAKERAEAASERGRQEEELSLKQADSSSVSTASSASSTPAAAASPQAPQSTAAASPPHSTKKSSAVSPPAASSPIEAGGAGGSEDGDGGSGSGMDSDEYEKNLWKIREYDLLLQYVMKLTAQSDKLKATTIDLQTKFTDVAKQNEALRQQLQASGSTVSPSKLSTPDHSPQTGNGADSKQSSSSSSSAAAAAAAAVAALHADDSSDENRESGVSICSLFLSALVMFACLLSLFLFFGSELDQVLATKFCAPLQLQLQAIVSDPLQLLPPEWRDQLSATVKQASSAAGKGRASK
jgi:hypothetical protein